MAFRLNKALWVWLAGVQWWEDVSLAGKDQAANSVVQPGLPIYMGLHSQVHSVPRAAARPSLSSKTQGDSRGGFTKA